MGLPIVLCQLSYLNLIFAKDIPTGQFLLKMYNAYRENQDLKAANEIKDMQIKRLKEQLAKQNKQKL